MVLRRPRGDDDRVLLILYTRRECHLCEVAKEALAELRRRLPFEIEERDVGQRAEWEASYGAEVPVGVLGGRKVFKYRVEPERLRRAVRRRSYGRRVD